MSWLITPQQKVNWDPSFLTTTLWLDASHAASFTFSSGTTVSQWSSRSGSYALTQSDNAKRPSRSGSVNGLPTVVFDGTSSSMSVGSLDLSTAGQKLSIFCVFSAASGGDQMVMEHTANINANDGGFYFFRNLSNTVEFAIRAASFYSTFRTTGTATTSPVIFTGTSDRTLSANKQVGWLNGSGSGTHPFDDTVSGSFVSSTFYLGARGGSSLFFNGQLCELGIVPSVLPSDVRQKLEGYLAHKWGLLSGLPSDHPYKVNPPAP